MKLAKSHQMYDIFEQQFHRFYHLQYPKSFGRSKNLPVQKVIIALRELKAPALDRHLLQWRAYWKHYHQVGYGLQQSVK